MQTTFAVNAAQPFGELSLELTGQLPQSLQLSKDRTKHFNARKLGGIIEYV